MAKNKSSNLKINFLNVVAFLIILCILGIGVILILAGASLLGPINKGGTIACYVIGGIFVLIFVFIIAKIIAIVVSENTYKKNALDVKELFKNLSPSETQVDLDNEFNETAEAQDIEALNIYYTFIREFEQKSFKEEKIELVDYKIKIAIQNLIMRVKKTFGYFDTYLAIDFTKASTRKIGPLRRDIRKFREYFTNIREVINVADIIAKEEVLKIRQAKVKE